MKNYLPIGSVVKISNINKKLLIYGRLQKSMKDGEEVIMDYISCLYPEGNISARKSILFNHVQIEKIYFVGYQDAEEIAFREIIAKEYGKITKI